MTTEVLLPVFTGIIGIVVGALLNAWLTTRRERWNLKRDLYTRLLEHLGEAKHALDGLLDAEMDRPVSSEEGWKARRNAFITLESNAADEIRRATSVSAILLSAEAMKALRDLESEWAKAMNEPDLFNIFDRRLSAVKLAYEFVVTAARKDLKVGNWC